MTHGMRAFVGTKAVLAQAMTLGVYNQLRGWELPAGEDADTPGMLVEYIDGGKPNVEGHDGYVSWSPQDVFVRAYKPADVLDFGQALAMLKQGHAVARSGWNGKGMYIYLVGPGRYAPSTPSGQHIASGQPDGLVPYGPYLAMKTVDGTVVPWLASQTDLIAEDWVLELVWAAPPAVAPSTGAAELSANPSYPGQEPHDPQSAQAAGPQQTGEHTQKAAETAEDALKEQVAALDAGGARGGRGHGA